MHRRAVLTTLALAAALPAAAAAPALRGRALLMVEAPRCPFCAAFRREVLPGYASHPMGRAAPLVVSAGDHAGVIRVVDDLQKRPWGAWDGQVVDRFGLHWLIGFEVDEG